ncbi:MAG TPA: COX15/CtaA family protein [Gemmatimonadaceae bacterium]|nr:COX15/CtaA family protein [Gemmatimonadaceae bacterium]
MKSLRVLSYLALVVGFAHIVFGAIVRITGSGMGCGDHWPKCHGQWFPPLDRPDLIIEITHRYLALALLLVLALLAVAAWRRRDEAGVAGRGGLMRVAGAALALWIAPALLGAVTVWLGNTPLATVAHKILALALLAVLAAAVIRAGGFGADQLYEGDLTPRTTRASYAAVGLALVVIGLGALTAKFPGATTACLGFPLCNGQLVPDGGAAHVQLTHRIFAFLLAFHVLGLTSGILRRGAPPPIRRAAFVSMGLVLAQLALAAAMVLRFFPAPLRSAHQAVGVSIWVALFVLAYLCRRRSPASAAVPDERRFAAEMTPARGVAS